LRSSMGLSIGGHTCHNAQTSSPSYFHRPHTVKDLAVISSGSLPPHVLTTHWIILSKKTVLKTIGLGWGHSSSGRAPAWGPEFKAQYHQKKKKKKKEKKRQ
jgi:hypothetical protein